MELCELAFFTDDVSASTRFYQELFGVEPVHSDESVAIFDVEGVEVLIHETYEPGEGDLPAADHAGFAVEDLDESVEELVGAGFDLFREPEEYDWGYSAYLQDPDGRTVELTER